MVDEARDAAADRAVEREAELLMLFSDERVATCTLCWCTAVWKCESEFIEHFQACLAILGGLR